MSITPQRSEHQQSARNHARAPLAVRIILAVLAVLALAGAVIAIANIQAQHSYNQATRSLNADLKASASPTADWSTLAARQEQTDAQFKEAQSWHAILAPNLNTRIETNSAMSRTLTERIQAELNNQQAGSSSAQDSSNTSSSEPINPKRIGRRATPESARPARIQRISLPIPFRKPNNTRQHTIHRCHGQTLVTRAVHVSIL